MENTQVGVMIGAGAAKTGLFWMSFGGEGELRRAEMEGRNADLVWRDWEGEGEVRHQPFIAAVDIGSTLEH